MNDILPGEIARWHKVESAFRRQMQLGGFREVRTPLVEPTPLFVRAIGEATDVVEKEMYSFVHHDEALTLRPEATAGAARAYVEHGIHNQEPVSRWYAIGPMFRAERPQKGRYRQFYQLDAEIFGDPGPGCDAELIDMLVGFLRDVGVPGVEVFVNSLGGPETRVKYKEALAAALGPHRDKLSADSQRRLGTNPLRILDSKDPRDQELVAGCPSLAEFLSDADRAHWDELRRQLDALGTPYTVDARLVRGLDYYTRTLFEIKGAKAKLGAGDTLVGGGRYDGMIKELGGPEAPAIGFAAGIERLLIASDAPAEEGVVDAFIVALGPEAAREALVLARELRAGGVATEADTRGGSLKAQLRRSNALGARVAILLGDAELKSGAIEVKDLAARTQSKVARADVARAVAAKLKEGAA
jgi:histidyl-tRNA synthetase